MKERAPRLSQVDLYRRELARAEARLKELQENGTAALSRYDVAIFAQGDAELALPTAIGLVSHYVLYFKKQLGYKETKPTQPQLV